MIQNLLEFHFTISAHTINSEPLSLFSVLLDYASDQYRQSSFHKQRKSIGELVSALKTIEEYQPSHPTPENEIRVKIWRSKNRTIEFECYTMEGEGNTIFVGYLWAKPGVYGFGNGHAKFSAPDFCNWLTKNGMKIQ